MTDHDLLYVIGEPGIGKTTLVAQLTGERPWEVHAGPIPHQRRGPVAMPGKPRAAFGGTDTLGMSIARKAEAWVMGLPAPVILGEGDRLAYGRFFDVAASAGYRVHLLYLYGAPGLAAQRRARRQATLGTKPQNETWVKGRASKAARLAAEFGAVRVEARPGLLVSVVGSEFPWLVEALAG